MAYRRRNRSRKSTNYPPFHYKRWTIEEDALLIHLLARGISIDRTQHILYRTANSIIYRIKRNLGIQPNNNYSAMESAKAKVEAGLFPLVTSRQKRLVNFAAHGGNIRKYLEDKPEPVSYIPQSMIDEANAQLQEVLNDQRSSRY